MPIKENKKCNYLKYSNKAHALLHLSLDPLHLGPHKSHPPGHRMLRSFEGGLRDRRQAKDNRGNLNLAHAHTHVHTHNKHTHMYTHTKSLAAA